MALNKLKKGINLKKYLRIIELH